MINLFINNLTQILLIFINKDHCYHLLHLIIMLYRTIHNLFSDSMLIIYEYFILEK